MAPLQFATMVQRHQSGDPFVDCYGQSDRGRQRPANEDRYLIVDTRPGPHDDDRQAVPLTETVEEVPEEAVEKCQPRGTVLAVADGMGGHVGGSVASTLAVETASKFVKYHMDCLPDPLNALDQDVLGMLRDMVRHCRDALRRAGEASPVWGHMGTTLTVAYMVWPKAYIAHAGDSRCYLIRDHQMHLLTVDHTMAELMQDQPGYENVSPRFHHMLWNALSADSDEIEVQAATCYLQPGDALLLCTDGLYRHLSNPEIAGIVAGSESSREACQRLIDAANLAGGSDNITVILARADREDSSGK